MELLKEVWNTNLKVDETIRLLNSIVIGGEKHSECSKRMVEATLRELDKQRNRLKNEIESNS